MKIIQLWFKSFFIRTFMQQQQWQQKNCGEWYKYTVCEQYCQDRTVTYLRNLLLAWFKRE